MTKFNPIKEYWHNYLLIFCWCLYDGLSLKLGFNYPTNSIWHIGVLIFIFMAIIRQKIYHKAFKISFFSFLVVILLKISLNLIAAFGKDFQQYNSILNNAYLDFGVLSFVTIVHVYLGLKWRNT